MNFPRFTAADHQQLAAVLNQLSSSAREHLLRSLEAVAIIDERPLLSVLPLLGPTLRALSSESVAAILARVAQLAHTFPAGIVPLFRTLGRVHDTAGDQRTLEWIAIGAAIANRNPIAGEAFFSLTSRTSLLALRGASPTVYLSDIQGMLLKYLHMLSGTAVGLTDTDTVSFPPPLAEGDGTVIPLPFRIERFATYEENFRLYRVLVAHQVGRLMFGTVHCSPARLWSALALSVYAVVGTEVAPPTDLESYFRLFPRPDLLESLFLQIEGKRTASRLATLYPGLRTDLAWAESLPGFTSPEVTAVLSHPSESVWTNLYASGTAADALLLASQLYARFLRHAAPLPVDAISFAPHAPIDDEATDALAFLTGVELDGEAADGFPDSEADAARRRQALTLSDLRYVYDEWDFGIEDYRPHWCELREVPLPSDEGAFFSRTVARYADLIPDIKREFQHLRPRMYRQVKGLEDGEDVDLNAVVNARVDRHIGLSPSTKLYMARQLVERDVAVLFLVDVSASTAAPLPDSRDRYVLDLMKEAMVLLSVALEELGDAYAVYGFSSNGRYDVEAYPVKTFAESLSSEVQGHIGGLTARGSTRMGTAVRHATRRLKEVASRAKLLVLLSDGYPEDAGYGKAVIPPLYGLRDAMMAFREAERSGITPFCLTIDKTGHDYLRGMCPASRYMVIEDVLSLPTELPKIYQRYRAQLV